MGHFSVSPIEMISCLYRNFGLISVLVKRDILSRYRGSLLGALWAIINPLLMLAVFTFIFSVVFKARWGSGSDSKVEFALLLFAGLLIFNLFSECLNKSPGLIVSNANFVKKVVFPLEILPFVSLLAALFHAFLSLLVWLVFHITFYGLPPSTFVILPLIMLPLCFFLLGLTWALAALGVYLRDIGQFIAVLTTSLMFLSPIFYPISSFPEAYRFILYLNPMTAAIEQTRNVIYWGYIPAFDVLFFYWAASLFISWCGFIVFQKIRRGFSDVI